MMAATHHGSTPIDLVVGRLQDEGCNPRQSSPNQWNAKCPNQTAHKGGDRNPSLSVSEGPDGKALMHCHVGCALPDMARALDLTMTDLFPEKPPAVTHVAGGKRIKATYGYYNANGTLVFEVVRMEPKSFRQRQPLATGGWIWNLTGITDKPIYMLPQVRSAITRSMPIWIVEGEKDAENLQWSVDGAVTCNSGGAGPGKWTDDYSRQLHGAGPIRIIQDNDTVGLEHVRSMVSSLIDAGHENITVLRPPDEHKDISDMLAAGVAVTELIRVWASPDGIEWVRGAPPVDTALEQVEAAKEEKRHDLLAQLIDWDDFWAHDHGHEEWIAWPLIPAGRQIALFAPAKTGKSIVTLAAVAAVATGRSILGAPTQKPRSVLLLDYEMTNSDLQERLESLGYGPETDMTNLHYALLPSLPPLNTKEGSAALIALAEVVDAEVVVIDTMGRAVEGEENSADTYKDFARLTGLALKAAGRAVLRTDHAGKSKELGQRGSSAKNDDVDVVMRLDVAEGGWALTRTHTRVAWVPEKVMIVASESSDGTMTLTADRRARQYVKGTKELAARLVAAGATPMTSRREAQAILAGGGEGARTRCVGDALAWIRAEATHSLQTAPFEVGTTTGTTLSTGSGTSLGTTGTTLNNTRSDGGNHYGNHREPPSVPDGNQGVVYVGNHPGTHGGSEATDTPDADAQIDPPW